LIWVKLPHHPLETSIILFADANRCKFGRVDLNQRERRTLSANHCRCVAFGQAKRMAKKASVAAPTWLAGTAVTAAALIALNQSADAISNGQAVANDDPIRALSVSIYGSNDDCTGVKIASNLVLTAKHCKFDTSTRVIFSGGNTHKIADRYLPNSRRVGKDEYDLVLLRIDGDVPGPVAQIADELSTPKNGFTSWAAGYGGKKLTPTVNPLRKIEIEVIDSNYSQFALAVRAKKDGRVCDGDSGGPAYTQTNDRTIVWGINTGSFSGNSTCGSRELYTKLAFENAWIARMIAANRPKFRTAHESAR